MIDHQRADQPTLPFVVRGDPDGAGLPAFLAAERVPIRRSLTEHGAVLLRGFPVAGIEAFGEAVRVLSGEPLAYSERSSPRSEVEANIYTSTDYPPDEEIFLHNENSYQLSWPQLLYFYCDRPPQTHGATPLAGIRAVYESIDRSVRAEFARRKWLVARNFYGDFGASWRYIFNTDQRSEVEAYCAQRSIDFDWRDGGGLRTRAVREAVHRHPATGELVWFNHIAFFHHTTLPVEVRDGLLDLFGEDGLPSNTYYGDGGAIPDDVVSHLRNCYRSATRRFDWQAGDLLVVDNMLAAHGREPFTGPRRIVVAMAEAYSPAAVARPVG
jgi:alpha-ketoglutarate-dependent taurine dioxygenase